MTSICSRLAAAALLLSLAAHGLAQDKDAAKDKAAKAAEAQAAQLDKFIVDMFNANRNKSLCMLGNVPVGAVRGALIDQLKTNGLRVGETATREQVESALWTRFPCPFSPFRAELLPATAKDIEGVWIFPHDSQPYRYGAESPLQPKTAKDGIACEMLGFFPGGEYRTGTVPGANAKCPFQMAADIEPARARPRVANWAMVADGRLRITRSDAKDYVEEWDVYSVTKGFQALNMEIRAGDLVAYRRREKGLDPGISSEFRLLQRLP